MTLLISCRKKTNVLKYLNATSWGADSISLLMVYKFLIRSHLDYGSLVYEYVSEPTLRRFDVLQNECVRICFGTLRCTRVARMEVEANIPPLKHRRDALLISYGIKNPPERFPQQAR